MRFKNQLTFAECGWRGLARLLACLLAAATPVVQANPKGVNVGRGTATTTQNGSILTITASHNAWLNWSSFNIGTGETTTFVQPNSHSVVWNRINDANPSQILGTLNANGYVVLMNQNGFYFGQQAIINASGFMATSARVFQSIAPNDPFWQYSGPAVSAPSIVNYAQINIANGGSLYLVSDHVENHGTLNAPGGSIGLFAGKEVMVSDRPDGTGLSAAVSLPAGSVDNDGKIIADAGTICLQARVVNQNGLIQANSVRNVNGVIELVADDSVNLGPASILSAKGDDQSISSGGSISIKAASAFTDQDGSRLDVSGGALGGNGGNVSLCASTMDEIRSELFALAVGGYQGGSLLLDPKDIVIGSSGSGVVGSGGTVPSTGQPTSGTLNLNVNTAFKGFSVIDLQTTEDITLAIGTTWNLASSTGKSGAGCSLSLEAGRNIIFSNNSHLIGGAGWAINLAAGANFTAPLAVTPGVGGIYLNGGPAVNGVYQRLNGSVESADGNLTLAAGNEVIVGKGFIRTDTGGNLSITTDTGNVDAGTTKNNLSYTSNGPQADANMGGIATVAGGNLVINAGNSVPNQTPTIGCYGPGNLSITAKNQILGNFIVLNGQGTLTATDIGFNDPTAGANSINLGLAIGGWTLNAAHDIILNEVYNPNGSLNSSKLKTGPKIPFQFNYSSDASVSLTAGNSVQLLGGSVAHTSSNNDRPVIYPPDLTIDAGAGGLTLGNNVILYPSPDANLHITTHDHGSFQSAANGDFKITLSDSDSPLYSNFGSEHSASPLQLPGAGSPVVLNISGNIQDVSLSIPKAATINVLGDAINFFYTGQNLLAKDTTTINVGGDISIRTPYTSFQVSSKPDLSIFSLLEAFRPELNLGSVLTYDPTTHLLTFTGKMTTAQRDFLLNPEIVKLDPDGNAVLDSHGNPVGIPVAFENETVINYLFDHSQDVPSFPTTDGGLLCGGPGTFAISARNMDLGITAGIRTFLTALNPNIAASFTKGADIQITLGGNLEMTASQIASFDGGGISISVGGKMDVGGQATFTSDTTPKGIYTAHGGDVTLAAQGDINVNGSRIGTYDGGNINVTSAAGSVDAGGGGEGFFNILTEGYDPASKQLVTRSDRFFGSGIVALTRKDSDAVVGNIEINAAKDISAGSGGILQLSFNHAAADSAALNLTAGRNIAATSSGILGVNVGLKAGGTVTGLVVARHNINISAASSVNVTAVGGGNVSVNSSSGSVSGSIAGGDTVSVSGDAITASVSSSSGNTSTSGDSSGARIGSFAGVATVAAPKTTEDAQQTVATDAQQTLQTTDDPSKKDKPLLARSTGRVTVILPKAY